MQVIMSNSWFTIEVCNEFTLSCVDRHGVQKGYLVWGYFMSEINGGETFVEMDNEVVQAQYSMCPYHEYIINEP